MKRLITLLLTIIVSVSLVACGDTDTSTETSSIESQENSKNESTEIKDNSNDENNNDNVNLEQTLTFMGFKIKYPKDIALNDSDYGYTFRYNSDIAVLIEAPSTAGVMLEVDSLDNIVQSSEKYVIKTFENTVRELFSFGTTTQSVAESKKTTINGIDMLRVNGNFTNGSNNTTISYVGYYFLLDSDPIYIVGVPMKANVSIDTFIDQIANSVSK